MLFRSTPENTDAPIFPVYPESRGVSSLWFRHALKRVLNAGAHGIEDPIPSAIREKYRLPSLDTALVWIHAPERLSHAEAARKRFAFEEMFVLQIQKALDRLENDTRTAFPVNEGEKFARTFLKSLPFRSTHAQQRAIHDILRDFKKQHPMARLLEGDVGSGKTAVAAATAYAIVNSRPPERTSGTLQIAYMAPTEILAQQHFQSFIEYFKNLPINIALMTGSGCKKFPSKAHRHKATSISRAQLLKWIANGEIAMLVGTHALIQKSVVFQHLAYCIVDEQHRFGTRQRAALLQKPSPMHAKPVPHFLSMTATPIPRTLALTMYGDLDLSILDELPPGRTTITTEIVRSSHRTQAYERMRSELKKGRQAYVVCPRIEEPDPQKEHAVQAKSAKAEAARLQKDIFPEYEIGLLHGAMKPAEKDAVMARFACGKTHVLVATSVVEVGINVPNATVILIEGAERFGLAQLHQLRGRVQRSSHPPMCFLVSDTASHTSTTRLRALAHSSDGFKLAEIDLKTRGAGDLWGKKQWGISDIGMDALQNIRLIRAAREEATRVVQSDPHLTNHRALRARISSLAEKLHEE